ncbi:MAG: hypothetical protein KA035_00535, partial [Candidatus Levybacteria bacterium]|nr:hypothetical protein [Candidatus Levybacteria bacterium]
MRGREHEFLRPQQITSIELPHRAKSQRTRELLAADNYRPEEIIEENIVLLRHLSETPFGTIGQKMLKDPSLDFKDSFLGMTFVVAATNRGIFEQLKKSFEIAHGVKNLKQEQLQAPAQTFLTGMAQKEAYAELDHEEIAGMATAGMMDINLRLRFSPYVLETSGMGGDKGFMKDGKKTKVINASTLSAITLAGMGLSVLKHGSYANTSAVGSTEAAEALGINIHQQTHAEIKTLFDATGFYFSDAHASKTIHDLSHSPFVKYETINHLVGPMTPPVDRQTTLHKLLGVNEGVKPQTVARAYEFMNTQGYQRVGHAIILSGLDDKVPPDALDHFDRKKIKPHMILDEVSPYQTLIAVVQHGRYVGQELLRPEDFGVSLDQKLIQQINS